MNKELKQKLEDAGFESHYHDCKTCGVDSPTLSELIEACGGDFGGLVRFSGSYGKYYFEAYKDVNLTNGFISSTPEEAVANLWLALNEK